MNKKLSFGTKAGYGFGMAGECLAMNTFFIYFLFFLTDGVGMAAGIAGTVALIATFWGAFTDLFAGNRSDASRNPNGRRRPFIFRFAIPLGVVTFLTYTDWAGIPMGAKPVYFLIVAAAFWLFLSMVDLPYQSLGAEITDDYMEKNQIRAYANVLNYAGMILASSGTITFVAIFSANGSIQGAWSKVGLIFGLIILGCYWIVVAATKGKEPKNPNADKKNEVKEKAEGFFSMLKGALTIKPFRSILIYTIFGYGGILLFTSMYIYYLTYNMGMSEAGAATVMLVYSIMVIVISAVLGAIKVEKKTVVMVCSGVLGILMAILHFVGIGNMVVLYIMFFFFATGVSAYFVQIYSMVYDVCDIDEFKSGGSRAGGIVSMFYFVGKIMGGIAMAAVGWILQIAGYDAMALEQTAGALNGISFGALLLPGIMLLIGAAVIIKYPINARNYEALRTAIDKKNAGEEYTTEGFDELLK